MKNILKRVKMFIFLFLFITFVSARQSEMTKPINNQDYFEIQKEGENFTSSVKDSIVSGTLPSLSTESSLYLEPEILRERDYDFYEDESIEPRDDIDTAGSSEINVRAGVYTPYAAIRRPEYDYDYQVKARDYEQSSGGYNDLGGKNGRYSDHGGNSGRYSDHGGSSGEYSDRGGSSGGYSDHGGNSGRYSDHIGSSGGYSYNGGSTGGYHDHGGSYGGGHKSGHKVQPRKPGPYDYGTPNFKCEKSSETLYVTKTELTFDKKCFNVYKVKCTEGYDEGKVSLLAITFIYGISHYNNFFQDIGYQKHCNEFTQTRCRTVFDTSSEERCWTVYKKQCDMVYETVVDWEYKQKCTTSYEEECHGHGYHKECESVGNSSILIKPVHSSL